MYAPERVQKTCVDVAEETGLEVGGLLGWTCMGSRKVRQVKRQHPAPLSAVPQAPLCASFALATSSVSLARVFGVVRSVTQLTTHPGACINNLRGYKPEAPHSRYLVAPS